MLCLELFMEKLELKTADFEIKPEMRCKGSCRGSCSCPKGHCRCSESKSYISDSYETPSSDSYQFKQAA